MSAWDLVQFVFEFIIRGLMYGNNGTESSNSGFGGPG